jgi:2-oxoglutarate dehydrogenase E2 component (dihydrolipoamide succinyltransferase)
MAMIDIAVPEDLEGTKSVVRNWLKNIGDTVAADEALVELETDKVAMEVFAPIAGVLQEIVLASGADAAAGALLGRMATGGAEAAPRAAAQAAPAAHDTVATPERAEPAAEAVAGSIASFDPSLRLSPSVRRLLMAEHADPSDMVGTGRDGRLTLEDVKRHLADPAARRAAKPASPGTKVLVGRRIPHDAMRLRIAEHMAHSLASAPHVTAVFEADFGAIMADRKARKPAFEAKGVALTYTAYIVSACVQAMAAAPAVNSRWHDDALEVFEDINIGVGTALADKGLIVPVVHRAQSLNLLGIATRLQDMTERARNGRLAPADVQGGTFSISNHGVSGSLLAAPIIINQPQSAILGVGKLGKRVVVREVDGADAIAIRPMAFVTLSIDHRVLDGHQTNAWLSRFVEVLETWPSD